MLKSYCRKQKMKYHSKKNLIFPIKAKGFTLAEASAAILILAFICSGVLVVVNRAMNSAVNSTLKMQAFETARENMEDLLSKDAVEEYSDFGYSDKYPQIQWQTTVEPFYEPITDRLWVQAICSAEYTDSKGELKKVELTHWLTDLSKKQILEMLKEKKKQQDYLGEIDQLTETTDEAAEYAGVDEETIEQWAENGMPVTEDGYFIKEYLDLYKQTNGNPSAEEKSQAEAILDKTLTDEQNPDEAQSPDDEEKPPEPKANCDGLPPCQRIPCLINNGQEDLITWNDVMVYWNECFD